MKLEITSKKYVEQVSKVDLEVSILDKPTFLHFHYSGGYDYFIKFIPSSYIIPFKNVIVYTLDFIFMNSEKIIKSKIDYNPLDRFHSISYNENEEEFKHIDSKQNPLPTDYLTIIVNYWFLQKRLNDCFFKEITEEEFNKAKENFFNNFS